MPHEYAGYPRFQSHSQSVEVLHCLRRSQLWKRQNNSRTVFWFSINLPFLTLAEHRTYTLELATDYTSGIAITFKHLNPG